MVTVSHIVGKIIKERPKLEEALSQGIVSFGNLAEKLKKDIEIELGKEVKHSAIVMALRRHSEKIDKFYREKSKSVDASEIIIKTRFCDITVIKSPSLISKLKEIYNLVHHEKGDMLNIIHASYEVGIIINERYRDKVLDILKKEKVVNIEDNLVLLTLRYPKEFLYTPGAIFTATRKLTWNDINIIELVSTLTELTFVINKKDVTRAYNALQELVENR